MSIRSKFTPLNEATQGVGGACNLGIFLTRHHRTGTICVEKRVHPRAIDKGDAETEANAMKQCDGHPNIIALHSYTLEYRNTSYGSLFMQHAELGSLDALITRFRDHRTALPDEGFVWKILCDCAVGLAHLQTGQDARTTRQHASNGTDVPRKHGWDPIFHRDLKPSNIFMTWQNRSDNLPYPTLLLADFGCAVFGSEVRAGNAEPGQAPPVDHDFVPPEHPHFSDRSDIYSLGLIILCLANRSPQKVPGPKVLQNASAPMRTVMERCLQNQPLRRPSPQQLPAFVLRNYQKWLVGRRDCGVALPSWAYGSG